ncbi:DUF5665 domain-containing protein [Nioella sp.]|uniref:DUF5665 domain-containing protein n=1 Tax=Nioella sp. TaxID=1912091 RepID=UPI003A8A7EE7
MSEGDDALSTELRQLREEVAVINQHRLFTSQSTVGRMLALSFGRGLAFGLGSVIGGASFLVSAVVYSLSQVDFIPVIGEWAARIADEITAGR